jgi:putative membrane protein
MNRTFNDYLSLVLKGIGMGAANVIPGVSGGTIALITGIFEELIDSIKSFDLKAAKLMFTGKLKEFSKHINLGFLVSVFLGIGVSIYSLAWLLKFLFEKYPVYVWAFFFGLIMASVYFVGKTISKWDFKVVIAFLLGTSIAVYISLVKPAEENAAYYYLILCGVVAICSMILPGLSGSFILILMGNYQLVMIDAVSDLNLNVLIPVGIGAVVGLVAFSHFLSWVYKKYRNMTISLLTGFILGSLSILWPWQTALKESIVGRDGKLEEIITGYDKTLPSDLYEIIIALAVCLIGIVTIWLIEKYAGMIKEEA